MCRRNNDSNIDGGSNIVNELQDEFYKKVGEGESTKTATCTKTDVYFCVNCVTGTWLCKSLLGASIN